jgi:hypothetical protein
MRRLPSVCERNLGHENGGPQRVRVTPAPSLGSAKKGSAALPLNRGHAPSIPGTGSITDPEGKYWGLPMAFAVCGVRKLHVAGPQYLIRVVVLI